MKFYSLKTMLFESKESLGIIFFLPTADRPATFPSLPEKMQNSKFWHTGIIYNGFNYECLSGAKNILEATKTRIQNDSFNNVIFTTLNINVPLIIANIETGTDCATYVARILGYSNTTGYEKDSKWYPDDVYTKLMKTPGITMRQSKETLEAEVQRLKVEQKQNVQKN